MVFYVVPLHYTHIMVHPDHDLAWFEKHWEGYAPWIKKVSRGMKSFEKSFVKSVSQSLDGSKSEAVQ